jgi:hypothetical protein
LAVFAAGCTLEAAEAVCGTTLERLSSLVDHNLLRHTATADGSRYSMLETIQEYALERLETSGEAPKIRRRQLDFLIRLAEGANLFAEAEEAQRQELVIPEYETARAAISWALEAGETELGLRLAVALENLWVTRDPFEGMRVFERLLAADAGAPPTLRARALRPTGVRRRFLVPVPSQPDHEAMVDERRCVRSCVVSGDTVGVQRPHADVRPLGTAGQPLERGHVDRDRGDRVVIGVSVVPAHDGAACEEA